MSQSLNIISKMSKIDKERLMQCILCTRNIDNCDIEDEDEQGFCNQYKKRDGIEFVRRSEKVKNNPVLAHSELTNISHLMNGKLI